MKTIIEYLINNHVKIEDEFRMPNIHSDELVYDYNDEPWLVKAYSYLDNHMHIACGGIKSLLDKYDMNGSAADDIEMSGYSDEDKKTTIYVGVEHPKNGTKAAFLWGEGGVYYKK